MLVTVSLLAIFSMLLIGAHRLPLSETDEGFSANRALSFERHHSWILTYDDFDSDSPQFHKPPLVYWIIAGLYRVIGVSPLAARLPVIAASIGVCLLIFFAARRHLGDWCALAAAILPCTIPFIFNHMRSAMLEMPFILCCLPCVLLFADRPGWKAAAAAGLLGGAAFLIKGLAGFACIPFAMVLALLWREERRSLAPDACVLILCALAPAVAYFLAIPDAFRAEALRSLLVHEPTIRISTDGYNDRLAHTAENIAFILMWHVPAAVCGMLLLASGRRDPAIRRWMWLTLCMIGAAIFITAASHSPYPRYAIFGMLFALSCSAYFCRRVADGGAARWLLLPMAAASLIVDSQALRWIPFTASIAIFLVLQFQRDAIARTRLAPALAAVLLAAITIPSTISPMAWMGVARDHRFDQPGVIPLARRVADLLPPNEKLLIHGEFKCHAVQFYSNRALESVSHWLKHSPPPGETRYAIVLGAHPKALRLIDEQVLARSGPWVLVRVAPAGRVAKFDHPVREDQATASESL